MGIAFVIVHSPVAKFPTTEELQSLDDDLRACFLTLTRRRYWVSGSLHRKVLITSPAMTAHTPLKGSLPVVLLPTVPRGALVTSDHAMK
ncbi:hypothetical protein EVAR_33158_1 [Eumeta japonica]|uniref:Uncharacterized protein n=1 Tax=Eumeta variegata TaxID=151549 RepID=A0A4C1ZVF9_EUMVA|nr:hypothetical protein EVAR_33158_1 [Eumeta japonica]